MTFLKDFFIGLAIFLVPVASFFTPYNLRQLSTFDISLIIESLIVILSALIIFSMILNFAIKKLFNIQPQSIFLLSCFGFYLLFLFTPFKMLVTNTILQQGFASYFTLVFLLLIWLAICFTVFHFQKFALVFRRSILIFACINILFFLILNIGYLSEVWNTKNHVKQDLRISEELDLLNLKNKSNDQNIYYVILDGMISLELAAKLGIVDEIETKTVLHQAGLTYIDKSYSSYNVTYLSIASIIEVDYHITEQNVKYSNTENFFPAMMYQTKKKIQLPELINKLGSKFIWVGNKSSSCIEWDTQPWTCIYSNKVGKIKHLVSTFYATTPFEILAFHLLDEGGNRNLKYYMEYSQQNKMTKIPKFVFIHQNSPHNPYDVNENCQSQPNNNNIYEGYKASYRCVLKEVLEFMTYIKFEDPKAIVVFQADHGWVIPEKLKTPKDKVLHRATIFNAVKAPSECFKKFGKPHSTVNTIRFVLNCAYRFDLPYRPIVHHQAFDIEENDPRFGTIKSHIF